MAIQIKLILSSSLYNSLKNISYQILEPENNNFLTIHRCIIMCTLRVNMCTIMYTSPIQYQNSWKSYYWKELTSFPKKICTQLFRSYRSRKHISIYPIRLPELMENTHTNKFGNNFFWLILSSRKSNTNSNPIIPDAKATNNVVLLS